MTRSVYVTSAEGHTGKSTIALGVLEALQRRVSRVGVFRPVSRGRDGDDYVLSMLLEHDGVDLDASACVGVTYEDVHADPDAALATIVARYKAVEEQCDAVVVVGSDYTDVGSPTELGYNARVAVNLGAPVLLVLGGRAGQGSDERLGRSEARDAEEIAQLAELAVTELRAAHAALLAVVVNRADPDRLDAARSAVARVLPHAGDAWSREAPVFALPEEPVLVAPSMAAIRDAVGGELVSGDEALLAREALDVVVAAMSMVNVLPRLTPDAVVVVPGDRPDVLLAVLTAHASETFPAVTGVVLNGGFGMPDDVARLVAGIRSPLPIVTTDLGSYDTTLRIVRTRGTLAADSRRKYDLALGMFDEHVDAEAIAARLDVAASEVVTPLMFQYGLLARARLAERRIVLPEGTDDRVLAAAATLAARETARLTILGDPERVRARAGELGLDLPGVDLVSPEDPELVERFAAEYQRLRAHKGMTLERAADTVTDVSYFGTMMVHTGLADGMVSGAAHTTAHTIRPAFEIIRTAPGVDVVSSVFLMALADRVLVYGDCAVIPDPTAEQLADIAVSSAATATRFGIEPRVAMLSYSTGESGSGEGVEKVRRATTLVRERAPELPVDGPIQYDAAADAAVGAAKMPGSPVAGRATVFVFPDLNTGNNTYKAVQRSAGALAVGPVLQGLAKPINDLSRGATVDDIVNTVAITAIQAGSE